MKHFTIYGRLDGLNEYTKANRANAYGGNALKKRNQKIVMNSILQEGVQTFREDEYPIFIIFKWYEPNSRRDLDNICFAKKFILDSLSERAGGVGIIKDDGQKQIIGFQDMFFTDKDNPRVEVEMYASDEPI